MVLADLLHTIDLEGAIVTVAATTVDIYHFRNGLQVASQAATWIYAMIRSPRSRSPPTRIIPGIELNPMVQVQALLKWLGDLLVGGWDLVKGAAL